MNKISRDVTTSNINLTSMFDFPVDFFLVVFVMTPQSTGEGQEDHVITTITPQIDIAGAVQQSYYKLTMIAKEVWTSNSEISFSSSPDTAHHLSSKLRLSKPFILFFLMQDAVDDNLLVLQQCKHYFCNYLFYCICHKSDPVARKNISQEINNAVIAEWRLINNTAVMLSISPAE